MLTVSRIWIEHVEKEIVTDREQPRFSFSMASDRPGCALDRCRITVTSEKEPYWDSGILQDGNQTAIHYAGKPLRPFTTYTVTVRAWDNFGEEAKSHATFSIGRMGLSWRAKWITDAGAAVPEKSSPVPLLFQKNVTLCEKPQRAWLCMTALGVYEATVNGETLGNRFFAPGFTSYHHQIQYQTYPVDRLKTGENTLTVRVGGGWAVGAFTYTRTNRTYADTPSLLGELYIEYADGSREVIGTDETWQVSQGGRLRFADWYDGEVYDATINESALAWKNADPAALRHAPHILAEYGAPVRVYRELEPIAVTTAPSGETIYDFGQNLAGVIQMELDGTAGQVITIRHAEVLHGGELFAKPLRTAKAQIVYTCRDGKQSYRPTMTYMGFRYAGVSGIAPERIKLKAIALCSDISDNGTFACSDERLNRLWQNIGWGGRSNFVDIPTDCPQRDERMGWTGDIAVFAETACFRFDMSRFFDKWLLDLRSEQIGSGALPMTVPKAGDNWKVRATGCWGDVCVLAPWAEYLARGDREVLRENYPMMRRFLSECERRAKLLSVGKYRYIWSLPFQFGDWCAPDEDFMQWIMKGKWVATAYFANSCRIAAQIAEILEKPADAAHYSALFEKISDAYCSLLCDRDGKLKKEFQTAYVLPLYFCMAKDAQKKNMAAHLARSVREAGNHPRTGFPGTPYLLFALADNGYQEAAFDTLLNEGCPGWLYAVKAGATTIWERWDALRPDGTVNTGERGNDGGMVSFNHYANGAVGAFLVRRIAGLEPTAGGYKRFSVKPLLGGGLTNASASVETPYGTAASAWRIENGLLTLSVMVPVSTVCTVTLPSGRTETVQSGYHTFTEPYAGGNRNA